MKPLRIGIASTHQRKHNSRKLEGANHQLGIARHGVGEGPRFEVLEPRVFLSAADTYAQEMGFGSFKNQYFSVKNFDEGSWEFTDGRLYVHVEGTTSKSSLKITKGVVIEDATVEGDLKSFSASRSDVRGEIDILGYVKSVTLEDIVGGDVGIESADKVSLKGGIDGGALFINDGYMKSLSISGSIRNESQIDLYRFGSVKIKGSLINSDLSSETDGVGTSLKVGSVHGSDLGKFVSYSIKGSLIDSSVNLHSYVKKFNVSGSMQRSNIFGDEDYTYVKKIKVKESINDSQMLIQYDAGLDDIYGNTDDRGFMQDGSGYIKSLSARFVGNSFIVSWGFGKVSFKGVQYDSDGKYGIFTKNADSLISRGAVKIGKTKYSSPIGDFVVEEAGRSGRPPPEPPPF